MSLCLSGFAQTVTPRTLTLTINAQHPLLCLAQALPWNDLLAAVLPDLQQTAKFQWWRGRSLRVRLHLGIYLLQQFYNYTDRQMEQLLKDNAAYQVFCGYGLVKGWHVPDHTKIEDFRSRLQPQTQRQLANALASLAVKRGYADPRYVDIDSTLQEANIAYPACANLLIKLGLIAKRLVAPLNELAALTGQSLMAVDLKRIKAVAKYYFEIRHQKPDVKKSRLQQLWREVTRQIWPILKESYRLELPSTLPRYWAIRRSLEQLQSKGEAYLQQTFYELFDKVGPAPTACLWSFHAGEIGCFNKNKLNQKIYFGRAYQLG